LKYAFARVIAIAATSRGAARRGIRALDDEGEVFCKCYEEQRERERETPRAGLPTAVPINNNPRFDATVRALAAAILHLLSRESAATMVIDPRVRGARGPPLFPFVK